MTFWCQARDANEIFSNLFYDAVAKLGLQKMSISHLKPATNVAAARRMAAFKKCGGLPPIAVAKGFSDCLEGWFKKIFFTKTKPPFACKHWVLYFECKNEPTVSPTDDRFEGMRIISKADIPPSCGIANRRPCF